MEQVKEAPLGALSRLKNKALAGIGVRSAKADKAAMGKAKQLYGIWQKTSASANIDPTKENIVNWLKTHKVANDVIETGFKAIGQDVSNLTGTQTGTKQIGGPAAGAGSNLANQMKAATTPEDIIKLLGQFKAEGKTRMRDILPSAMKLGSAVGMNGTQLVPNAQKLVDSGKVAQLNDLEKVGLALLIASQKVTLPAAAATQAPGTPTPAPGTKGAAAAAAAASPATRPTPLGGRVANPTRGGRLPGATSPQGAAPRP